MYVDSDVQFFATRPGRSVGYSYAIHGAIRRLTKAEYPDRQAFTACAALRREPACRQAAGSLCGGR